MAERWTITEDEYEQRQAEAQAAAAEAYERGGALGRECWGLASYGDGPPAAGGGVGSFLWFDSREALLDFVGRLLPFHSPGPSSADPGRVARETGAVVERARSGDLSMDDAMLALNGVLRGFSQLEWWGQLETLLTGDGPFERRTRAWAREHWTEDADDSAISADELEAFVEALRDYGI